MKLGSTRQAIHDALCWGQLQRQSGLTEYLEYLTLIQKSVMPNNSAVDMIEAAYICAAIHSLDLHLGGWLTFAYAPEPSGVVQDALASKLRFDLFPMTSAKKHMRLFNLASVSLEDYRLRVHLHRDLPSVVYAERVGVDECNWARDWREKQDKCLRAIGTWDKEGVGQVSRMVKSLRGEDDEGEQPSEILEDLLAK